MTGALFFTIGMILYSVFNAPPGSVVIPDSSRMSDFSGSMHGNPVPTASATPTPRESIHATGSISEFGQTVAIDMQIQESTVSGSVAGACDGVIDGVRTGESIEGIVECDGINASYTGDIVIENVNIQVTATIEGIPFVRDIELVIE